jgi:nitrite reductase (NAD(P)H)
VKSDLSTSAKDVYAIGECASWENQTFGLIAPGTEMAEILAFNLTQAKSHSPRKFQQPDMSTKLKLLGVEVASFGDYFADRDGPQTVPKRHKQGQTNGKKLSSPAVLPLTYKDPFQQIYKKYLFTPDGKYLLGGMMIGDTKDYPKLLGLTKAQKPLELAPGELIVGSNDGDDDPDALPDDTQVCSCNNVSKGAITSLLKEEKCKSIGEIKSCTKAGTGCSGCIPMVTTIFNKTMESMGHEIKNYLCPHFEYSRADLFNIVYVKRIDSFAEIMKHCGRDPESLGCEVCKPAVVSSEQLKQYCKMLHDIASSLPIIG